MSAQPHDRALQDLVLVDEAPPPRRKLSTQQPELGYRARRRAAVKHARASLYELRNGSYLQPSLPAPAQRRLRVRLPRNAAGPLLVLALLLGITAARPAVTTELTRSSSLALGAADREAVARYTAESAPMVFAPAAPVGDSLVAKAAPIMGAAGPAQESRVDVAASKLDIQPAVLKSSAYVGSHVVAGGETLGAIAEQYHISVAALAAANAIDPRLLPIGRQLRIPEAAGVPHSVSAGETVESIAAQYGVQPSAVRDFAPNGLSSGRALVEGEELVVPGATLGGLPAEADLAAVAARPVAVVRDEKTNIRIGPNSRYDRLGYLGATTPVVLLGRHSDWLKVLTVEGSEGWVAAELLDYAPDLAAQLPEINEFPPLPTPAPAPPTPAPAPPVDRWVWPAAGDFTSGFGYRNFSVGTYHNGIDIANGRGTPIRAARAGRVIAAGWCGGYGYCVKINHGDGIVSEYGHLYAQPIVSVGETVEAGQKIGGMGMTYGRGGYATGVHLHFTITVGGKAVNPLKYLP